MGIVTIGRYALISQALGISINNGRVLVLA
jgi:hypothetical protein